MALRQIRTLGDPILEKSCREVTEMTPRLEELIRDMLDTMYDAEGVGLAAPQVGVRRRIVVIDVGEGPIILINPEIKESDGEQTGAEGCLSVPGQAGTVTRPNHVIVRALNEKMEEIEVEGTELLARALCHELDHLDGIMYVTKVEGELYDTVSEDETEEPGGEASAEQTPASEAAAPAAQAEVTGKEEKANETGK
jgi:peptide deformylase